MMTLTRPLCAVCLILAMSAAAPVAAQQPWSPLKSSDANLITDGIFKQSPLKLPFRQVSVRNVTPETNKLGDDFEHVYAVPYDELLVYFTSKDNIKRGFDVIDPSVYPEGGGKPYRLKGIQDDGNGKIIRLANSNASRDFKVSFEPDGASTRVTFHNVVLTTLSSGVMPARYGFISTTFDQEIPFDWN